MTPAIEQTTVYIYQPQEFHNPGGSPNTIWQSILTEHTEEVQAVFASEFLDVDAVRVKTEWRRNEESAGGTMFVVYIEYALRDIGDVYVPSLVWSAIEKLPKGMTYRRMEVADTVDTGIWRTCSDCRGTGHHTRQTNGGRLVEIDCKNCSGTGRALTKID
jgi:hypothetical protein